MVIFPLINGNTITMLNFKLLKIVLLIICIGVQFIPSLAIAQEKESEAEEVCTAKETGITKEKYFSEYPTLDEISKQPSDEQRKLEELLKDKERLSKIWDNCKA